jgi:hypothetical protein
MHVARIFASVLILAMGMLVPAGTPRPGEEPVDQLANSFARLKAEVRLAASAAELPIAEGDAANGARALTDAAVVSSLMLI